MNCCLQAEKLATEQSVFSQTVTEFMKETDQHMDVYTAAIQEQMDSIKNTTSSELTQRERYNQVTNHDRYPIIAQYYGFKCVAIHQCKLIAVLNERLCIGDRNA